MPQPQLLNNDIDTEPHSYETEKHLLGCIFTDPSVANMCQERQVTPEFFYHPSHCEIYRCLIELFNQGKPTDLVYVTQILKDKGRLESIGGPGFVTEAATSSVGIANAHFFIEMLEEKYRSRMVMRACYESIAKIRNDNTPIREVTNFLEHQLFSVTNSKSVLRSRSMKQNVMEYLEHVEELCEGKKKPGLSTGIRALDWKIGGLVAPEYIVIIGLPGSGKSGLSIGIMKHNSIIGNVPGLFFSYEMSSMQITNRLVSDMCSINTFNFKSGKYSSEELGRLGQVVSQVGASPLIIEEDSDLNITELRVRARRHKRESNIQYIVVDYLQLIKPPPGSKFERSDLAYAEISHQLRSMAKELNLPVIALSQVNSDGEAAYTKAITQDARVIIKVDYAQGNMDPEGIDPVDRVLYVTKQNEGSSGGVPCKFMKKYNRFYEEARTAPWQT